MAVVAHKRPHQLEKALEALLSAVNVNISRVFVVQDGDPSLLSGVIKKFNVGHIVNKNNAPVDAKEEIAARISRHYGFMIKSMFEGPARDAEAVVVLEEDLLVSRDILVFFEQVMPLLASDSSLLTASAFNDNGFEHLAGDDPARLMRSQFFPGLGWLATRAFYTEILPEWPATHWDHWLRNRAVAAGRDTVMPMIPRTYHMQAEGAHVNMATFHRFFETIRLNAEPVVDLGDDLRGRYGNVEYLQAMHAAVSGALRPGAEWFDLLVSPGGGSLDRAVVLVYQSAGVNDVVFELIAPVFHLWHEVKRGLYLGTHQFVYNGRRVILMASWSPLIGSVAHPGIVINNHPAVTGRGALPVLPTAAAAARAVEAVVSKCGESCSQACASRGKTCDYTRFGELLPASNERAKEASHSLPSRSCSDKLDAPFTANPIRTASQIREVKVSTCLAEDPTAVRKCPCELGQHK